MLKKPSDAIRLYLERAATARERAMSADSTPDMQEFFREMESKWMNLAASAAHVENVDLFLQTRRYQRVQVTDLCSVCFRPMKLEAVEHSGAGDVFKFKCIPCNREQARAAADP